MYRSPNVIGKNCILQGLGPRLTLHRKKSPSNRPKSSNLPAIMRLIHETPLQTRGESRTTTTTKTRVLYLVQNPIMALQQDFLGLVPVASLERALELIVVEAIDVGENTVFVAEVSECCPGWGDDGIDGCCCCEGTDGCACDGCCCAGSGCGQKG